jgi:hypothetical protein
MSGPTRVQRDISRLATLNDVVRFDAQHVSGREADLTVYKSGDCVPFELRRVFTVHAHAPFECGHHAQTDLREGIQGYLRRLASESQSADRSIA